MPIPISEQSLKTAAKAGLVAILLSMLANAAFILQTQYQLVSDFIPTQTVWMIITPALYKIIAGAVLGLAGLGFFFYGKYMVTVVFGGIAVMLFFF